MRIEGSSTTNSAQQASPTTKTRFEQAMSRELSRAASGKSLIKAETRATPTAGSKRKAPGAERVGVEFKSMQPAKVLKGLKQGVQRTFGQASQGIKTAFASLGKALDNAMAKAKTFKDGPISQTSIRSALNQATTLTPETIKSTLKKLGTSINDPLQNTARQAISKAAEIGTKIAPGTHATEAGGKTAGGITSATGDATGPSTQDPASTRSAAPQTSAPMRADAASAPIAMPTLTTETAAPQEGRVALAPPEAQPTQEAILLHSPGMLAIARKARADGSALRTVHMLGPNAHGAEFVSITTDDTGFITGPEIDIALTQGGLDDTGNWVAQAGAGVMRGDKVALETGENGHAFACHGENGTVDSVTAWLQNGDRLHAQVIATRDETA